MNPSYLRQRALTDALPRGKPGLARKRGACELGEIERSPLTRCLCLSLVLTVAACGHTPASTADGGSANLGGSGSGAGAAQLAGGGSAGLGNPAGGTTAGDGGGGGGAAAGDDAGGTGGADTLAGPGVSTLFSIDTPNVVRRSNIVLGKPNASLLQYMPLGNGTLGVAVWAANGLTAQLNRGDTFPDRKSPGQVVIPGLSKLTGAADFSGHVDLYDGTLVESGGGMTATAYVRADSEELVVDVTGADPTVAQTAQLLLWQGRSPAANASGSVATLAETWKDTQLGNAGATFGTLAAISAGGRNVTTSVVNSVTVQVSFQPNADGSFRVIVASPTWSGGDAMTTAKSLLGADATASQASLQSGLLSWWHDYWSSVGLVEMTSPDGVADYLENLRTIYLYTTAAESRGILPGSQAGLADLFNSSQDHQEWYPAGYWFWNLRMQVAANMTSGAFAMNSPVFNLYQSNLANIEAWTQAKMGGRAGICIPETMRFNGNGYYNGGESNASCDQTIAPSYNALTITSGAEVGLWIWQQYLMTGDRGFLSTNYPVISQAATFLLAYASTGSDGQLHTLANAHETQWAVQDPITDIVAMQALFPAVISAAQTLGTDASLVSQLQAAIPKLPPWPRTDAATHTQVLTASADSGGQDVIALSAQPAAAKHNSENLDLEAAWPYGLIGDAGPNTALAKRTYAHRVNVYAADWSFDSIQAARLGLPSDVQASLVAITKNYQFYPSGMANLGGNNNPSSTEPYLEQAGEAAASINEALVQDYDGLVRIAPAWPSAWDAAGTVYIQGQSKVDVQFVSGKLVLAVIEAGTTATVNVRNPWPGQVVSVVDGSTRQPVATSTPAGSPDALGISTVAGHWYVIAPASTAATLPPVVVTGTPATKLKALGAESIGL